MHGRWTSQNPFRVGELQSDSNDVRANSPDRRDLKLELAVFVLRRVADHSLSTGGNDEILFRVHFLSRTVPLTNHSHVAAFLFFLLKFADPSQTIVLNASTL